MAIEVNILKQPKIEVKIKTLSSGGGGSAEDYQNGYNAGYMAGESVGLEAGKQAEYDRYWDMLQQNGTRIDYQQAFRLVYTDETFKPKYDIIPDNAQHMFAGSKITNLKKLLEDADVVLDFSKARYLTSLFDSSAVTHVPTIDCSNVFASAMSNIFINAKAVVYIEKMIVKAETKFTNAFTNANSLVEIRFEGTIGEDISFQWSPLSKESFESVVSHLSGAASGKTATFKKTAVRAAFGTEEAWLAYIASKPNWNFTLV